MGKLCSDRIYRLFRIDFLGMRTTNILLILFILSNPFLGL
jgi:hypothetical protein